jgi:membrane protease YdiL (CAAX protease family)
LQRSVHWIFLGPDGLRSVWRIVVAVALYKLLVLALQIALTGNSTVLAWMQFEPRDVLTPGNLLFSEAIRTTAALIAGGAMSKIEERSFADYGFPLREAFGKRFWQGVAYGLAMLALLMTSIAALGGFALGGLALGAGAAVRYGALYALGFLLVGLFEECTFRGYLLATLESGIGFWPAAIVLSVWFGAAHLQNPGEAKVGVLMAGCFGLLAAFSLWRIGNLWFAIGMHTAWDWGETYFCGVPNSGVMGQGHVTVSSLHGPVWLTGGTDGPEASVFVFVVLILSAAGVHYLVPAKPKEI